VATGAGRVGGRHPGGGGVHSWRRREDAPAEKGSGGCAWPQGEVASRGNTHPSLPPPHRCQSSGTGCAAPINTPPQMPMLEGSERGRETIASGGEQRDSDAARGMRASHPICQCARYGRGEGDTQAKGRRPRALGPPCSGARGAGRGAQAALGALSPTARGARGARRTRAPAGARHEPGLGARVADCPRPWRVACGVHIGRSLGTEPHLTPSY